MNKRIKKKRQTEEHLVDMTARLHIKIVETTIEEEEEFQNDLINMQIEIEKQMQKYEDDIKKLFQKNMSSAIIDSTEDDADRYIEKYKTEFATRRKQNVERRIQQILNLLEEPKT